MWSQKSKDTKCTGILSRVLIIDGFSIHSLGACCESELPLDSQTALLRKVLSKGKWINIKIFREELEGLELAHRPLPSLAA